MKIAAGDAAGAGQVPQQVGGVQDQAGDLVTTVGQQQTCRPRQLVPVPL